MATMLGDSTDVDGAAKVVAAAVEEDNGSDVEVDAVAPGVAEDPDRVMAQAAPAAPSANTTITTSGAVRLHRGRFRMCLPRMVNTLAECVGRPADGSAEPAPATRGPISRPRCPGAPPWCYGSSSRGAGKWLRV
jgi:hypothetical protein